MAGLTLQINSLEALERLLGGDNELEASLRHSIVAEFAKHHLKAVAETIQKNLINGFAADIQREMTQTINAKLTERIKDSVFSTTVGVRQDIIDKAVAEASAKLSVNFSKLAEKYTEDMIKTVVDQKIDFYVTNKLNNVVVQLVKAHATSAIGAAFVNLGKQA